VLLAGRDVATKLIVLFSSSALTSTTLIQKCDSSTVSNRLRSRLLGEFPSPSGEGRRFTYNTILQAVRLQERANTPSQDVRLA
jgi:hypothetical protein